MARIELSPVVVRKLSDIGAYISGELASPIAAQNTVSKILDTLERLERFPDSGPMLSALYDKVPQRYANTRFIVCGNYIAVYDHDGDVVRVLQLYHGTEDYIRHLFKMP